jgi:hypothetical protein
MEGQKNEEMLNSSGRWCFSHLWTSEGRKMSCIADNGSSRAGLMGYSRSRKNCKL